MIRRLVLYPILFGIFPIISLYAHNVREARPVQILAPVAAALMVIGLVWGTLTLILRKDAHRAGLVTLPLLVLCYSASSVLTEALSLWLQQLVTRKVLPEAFQMIPLELIGVEVILCAALIALILIRVKTPRDWTAGLNRFSLILVGLPALTILSTQAWSSAPGIERIAHALDTPLSPGPRPDIYYIILDGFGRSDVLRELYDYDLEPFLDHLESKGFVVARASTTNYSQTRLSLASSLNGSYLDELKRTDGNDEGPLRDLIRDNGIVRALRGQGYKIIDFDTGYHLTEDITADEHLTPFSGLSEFHRLLLRTTVLAYLLPDPVERDPAAMARRRTLSILDSLPRLAQRPEPTFTFAHILAPHPPFVFDAEGNSTENRGFTLSMNDGDEFQGSGPGEYVRGYRGQVTFLATQVEAMLDRLLAESPEPPIILLQADHGPGSRLIHSDVDKTDVHERMSILNAYHLPGVGSRAIPADITPVNSFRLVLNTYFGAHLEPLESRNYVSRWSNPYDFVDVTARVRPPAPTER